jgi:four helix bundle protein
MADSIICARSFEFGVRILNLCARLWYQGPKARRVASELIRCGTSIGANAEEAQDGQTKPDYIAKMSICRKESREALYWLRLGLRAQRGHAGRGELGTARGGRDPSNDRRGDTNSAIEPEARRP